MAFWGVPRGGVSSGVLELNRGKLARVGGIFGVPRGGVSSGVLELDRDKLVRVGGVLGGSAGWHFPTRRTLCACG